jgi:hypothetical protein
MINSGAETALFLNFIFAQIRRQRDDDKIPTYP